MNKKDQIFLSSLNIRSIPEHPAGKAYMDEQNAIADALSKDEVVALSNKVRAKHGLPPRTVEEVYGRHL
jgi:uncharacterized protein YkwD